MPGCYNRSLSWIAVSHIWSKTDTRCHVIDLIQIRAGFAGWTTLLDGSDRSCLCVLCFHAKTMIQQIMPGFTEFFTQHRWKKSIDIRKLAITVKIFSNSFAVCWTCKCDVIVACFNRAKRQKVDRDESWLKSAGKHVTNGQNTQNPVWKQSICAWFCYNVWIIRLCVIISCARRDRNSHCKCIIWNVNNPARFANWIREQFADAANAAPFDF